MNLYFVVRSVLVTTALSFAVAGCGVFQPDAHMAAFSTQMTGMNEVPPVGTAATGRVDAVLDKNTRLFRWKMSFTGLTGPATAGHFHGPAVDGTNAGITLPLNGTVTTPLEGQAILTPAQAADLLDGKWYVNIHTQAHAGGEIRGQLILRE